jgi:hypothetical protein
MRVPGACGVIFFLLAGARLGAADFIRGDANGDGKVSLADAEYLDDYLFKGGCAPACVNSGDANDDGKISINDTVLLANYLVSGESPPAAPFPSAGADPTPDAELTCDSYGGGFAIDDPGAQVEVLDATAVGGTDQRAVITVAVSSSHSILGYSGSIVDGSGVVADGEAAGGPEQGIMDLSGSFSGGFLGARIEKGRIVFGTLLSFTVPIEMPPGQRAPALEMAICLKPGTAAGQYPLTLEAGELISGNYPQDPRDPSGCRARSITPVLVSGTLTVESNVVEEGGFCSTRLPPPPPPEPQVNVTFKLADTSGAPGSAVAVPFSIKADRASQGFSYSVDFDEEILEAHPARKLWQKPDGSPYDFEKFDLNNESATPGNAGIDEGYLTGAAIISLTDTDEVLPPRQEIEVLAFDFLVKPTAPVGSTELRFLDGGLGSGGGHVKNKLISGGKNITPDIAASFVFVNGLINIIPDGTPFAFVRGDSNGDEVVNITDPKFTLNYLFLGSLAPRCLDAADATDDGRLDISDAVSTLNFLFLGETKLPAPNVPGPDPTPDDLGCKR